MKTDLVNAVGQLVCRLLLPPMCVVCGARVVAGGRIVDLCGECEAEFPNNSRCCSWCADELPENVARNSICGACQRKKPKFDRAYCAYRYSYPIDQLIRAFKFQSRLAFGRVLGEALSASLLATRREPWPEVLLPVPLATLRFRKRGFNQAIELGRVLEARLKIPLRCNLIIRTRETVEQTGLDAKARRKNIRGAFVLKHSLKAKHVAVLDDVITTGSTANELARVLRRGGVRRIEIWAVARTTR